MDDIARRAGVSKTTISRVLNGNYSHTSDATRRRVLDIVRELDYHPNEYARGLKRSNTNVIGILLSNLRNPYWATVLEGVEDTCRLNGFNLMICNSGESGDVEREYLKNFQRRKVDGIIVNPTTANITAFERLVQMQYPVVLVNRKLPSVKIRTIAMDNVLGAALAVEHLLHAGRRRIALFTYPTDGITTWSERVEGYRQAMFRHGFTEHDLQIITVEQGKGNAAIVTKQLLSTPRRPDAIVSASNVMTLDILDGINEARLKIPNDIAFVGYDETDWARHMEPPLTTIRQPAYDMGKIAAQSLIDMVQNKTFSDDLTVLRPDIIIRKSSVL